MKLFGKFLFIPIIILIAASCQKFVEIPPPRNAIVSSTVFSDSSDATSAIIGLYISFVNFSTNPNFLSGNITLYSGLASDELTTTTGFSDELSFYTNSLSSQNGAIGSMWSSAYSYLYQTNACIEGLTGNNKLTVSVRNRLLGEAKFIRAFCYFQLVNLYGKVPLVTTTDYKVNEILPRASEDTIFAQIISDLTDAENLIPVDYIANEKIRPNQYAVSAMLSKVYLYRKDWANAEKEASKVIGSGVYNLEQDLNNVFLSGTIEALWQLPPIQQGYETPEGNMFVPGDPSLIPNYVISNYLLHSFDSGDLRFSNWLDSNVVDGQTYYYPYKYKQGILNSSFPLENYSMLRLGELYLIRAEAEAQGAGNGMDGAIEDLNKIRNRAGLPVTDATDQLSLLEAIYHERRIEMFCEWGNRWYDLKRTGKVDSVMGNPVNVCENKGGTWQSDWQLFPIPFPELQTNQFLSQNAGYQ